METQNRGVELALFLTLPATAAFVFAAEPIVRGLFEHGAFGADDTVRVALALSMVASRLLASLGLYRLFAYRPLVGLSLFVILAELLIQLAPLLENLK